MQGNGPAGYFDARQPYDVFRAQLAATRPLEGEDLDALLWPQGGVDADPTQNASVARELDALGERLDTPLLIGAVTQRGDEYFNSSSVWEQGADNPVATYDKRHPAPVASSRARPLVPWPGRRPPHRPHPARVHARHGDAGPVHAGRGSGGPLPSASTSSTTMSSVMVPDRPALRSSCSNTNNADFRGTDENLQQLAFARMRAIEAGRSVVNLSIGRHEPGHRPRRSHDRQPACR